MNSARVAPSTVAPEQGSAQSDRSAADDDHIDFYADTFFPAYIPEASQGGEPLPSCSFVRYSGKTIMPRALTAANWKELTPEERQERRQLRRQKQRDDNIGRAAKMHLARLQMEGESPEGSPELKRSVYVGCSGWRYWKWRDSFYADVPQKIGSSTT